MTHRLLDWDSDFFGFGVARVDDPHLAEDDLRTVLADLRRRDVRLVYWPAGRTLDDDTAARLGAFLADRKTTCAADLRALELDGGTATDVGSAHDPSVSLRALERLAVQSGAASRFAVDPRIPHAKFVALYEEWIRRSVRGELASEVLVVRDAGDVAGMVTLGDHEGRGDIGLLAVDAGHRGKRYGQALVHAAQRWFLDHGTTHGRVVTQGANDAACRLYESCGYTVESVEFFYHVWLDAGCG